MHNKKRLVLVSSVHCCVYSDGLINANADHNGRSVIAFPYIQYCLLFVLFFVYFMTFVLLGQEEKKHSRLIELLFQQKNNNITEKCLHCCT